MAKFPPKCPRCGSRKAKPHCEPTSLTQYASAEGKEPKMRERVKPTCPWLRCAHEPCGHTYDAKGRSYDPKQVTG